MTIYQGGKSLLGREIYAKIKQLEKKFGYEKCSYSEPFCGMLGVGIHAVRDNRMVRFNDLNESIILMWKAFIDGWIPDEEPITREEYNVLIKSTVHSKEKGFYGVTCAYGGIMGGGYRVKIGQRDLYKVARLQFIRMAREMEKYRWHQCIRYFRSTDYREIDPEEHWDGVFYCDPPYAGNNFRNEWFSNFNHNGFWEWVREMARNDNLVIVSEYVAPDDFECVWERKIKVTHSCKARDKIERLFLWKDTRVGKRHRLTIKRDRGKKIDV